MWVNFFSINVDDIEKYINKIERLRVGYVIYVNDFIIRCSYSIF